MVPIVLGTPINLNMYFLTLNHFTIYEHSAQWTQPASDGTYQYFIKVSLSSCMYVAVLWLNGA
jgi:hypothetical protein